MNNGTLKTSTNTCTNYIQHMNFFWFPKTRIKVNLHEKANAVKERKRKKRMKETENRKQKIELEHMEKFWCSISENFEQKTSTPNNHMKH